MNKLKTIVKTNCSFCGYQCGLVATIENGYVVKVQPDSSRFPYGGQILKGCKRWSRIMEVMNHPKRINYPMKRVGERGNGQWQRITWEQALNEIAAKLKGLKEKYGPEVLSTSIGGPHTAFWPLHRFMSLFGSPNNMGIGQICWNPGIWVNSLTYGWPLDMELSLDYTESAILWGTNPAESDNSLFWHTIKSFSQCGKPLIVVDPRYTKTAEKASLWLCLKPGTDVVLALGLLHVIVKEGLFDKEFVEHWCHGFDQLSKHLLLYSPSYVESITGVKAVDVIKAAQLYAENRPGCIYNGRGIDQLGANTFQIHRCLAILRAITGNVDVPGASHIANMPNFVSELELELSDLFLKKVPASVSPEALLQSYHGYAKIKELTMKHKKQLPMRYLTSVHPHLLWKAMLTDKPYPVRSLIVMASNPLLTQADTELVYEALKSLDLLVALELFQTPTSMLADYILPIAGVLEKAVLETKAGVANIAYGGEKAVEPYYERRTDYYFWRELGLRLGQKSWWPWETSQEAFADSLAPVGVTWQEFCQTGLYCNENKYYKYAEQGENGGVKGFATTTGKIELFSEVLKELGVDPLPASKEVVQLNENYPLLMISGARFQPFYASSYQQIDSLRKLHPEPVVEMNDKTAEALNIIEGEKIYVETEKGKALFLVRITPMFDNVVSVEYGRWYPEMPACEPELGGVWVSNANVLTSSDMETSDPLIGTWVYNGIPCRVEKTTENK